MAVICCSEDVINFDVSLNNTKKQWMDDMRFYVLSNSISVISRRWKVDNERLCAMELHLRLRRFRLERGSNSVRQIRRPALNPLSCMQKDGLMTCAFTFFSTVFQSYQDDGKLIMKGCVQWNSVYG